jgi:hypothetical protein
MRVAGVLVCSTLLVGCAEPDDPEAAAYADLEGIYEIDSVERYPGACDEGGRAEQSSDFSSYWVAYAVSRNVPDVQLHAHGCGSPEHCREQASDVQADGALDHGFFHFTRLVYSRVSSDGAIDGVGVTLVGVVGNSCRLFLEESSVAQSGEETLFKARERLGVEYPPAADGSCPPRDDLSAEWRNWTDHQCTDFTVIRTRLLERL